MAEEKGFEPLRRSHDLPVFKTGPFNQTWVFLHLAFLQRQVDYSITIFKMSTKKVKIFHFPVIIVFGIHFVEHSFSFLFCDICLKCKQVLRGQLVVVYLR